jgi:hypothetical protein
MTIDNVREIMPKATMIMSCLFLLCVATAGCGKKNRDAKEPDPGEETSSTEPVEGEPGQEPETVQGGGAPEGYVQQPGTDLYWSRCPLDQTWSGEACEGDVRTMTLAEAIEACSGETRLPGASEYEAMLGGCGESHCNSCAQSEACTQMFGSDERGFWTMTEGDKSIAGKYARFHDGYVNIVPSNNQWHVRCVWDGGEAP